MDRAGSHRTCGHPRLPPRRQRFRPSWRSLFFRDGRFRAPPPGMATVPTLPTPHALQCLGLGWSGSSADLAVPRVPGIGVSPPTQGEAGQAEGPGSPRQPRPPRAAADQRKGSREPRLPTQNSGGRATPYPPLEQPASRSLLPGTRHVRPAPRVRAPPRGRSRRAPGSLVAAAALRWRPGGPGFLSWPLPLSLLSSFLGLFPPPYSAHPPFLSA